MFTVDPEKGKDWVNMRVDSTINGYAYNTCSSTVKVAIAFLMAYCIIALGHIVLRCSLWWDVPSSPAYR